MATSGPKKRKPPAKKAPAKDLKPGDSRKKFAEGPKKKAAPKVSSGTLTDRMGEAKARPNKGLPARIEKPRGNLNRAMTPDRINLGGQGGTGRSVVAPPREFKPYSLGDKTKLLAGPAGRLVSSGIANLLRKAGKASAVGLMVDPSFMSYKTGGQAGPGSDKPSGPLMKGTFGSGDRRAAGKKARIGVKGAYPSASGVGPFKPKPSQTSSSSYMKDVSTYKGTKPSISMANGGVNNPTAKAVASNPKAEDYKKKNLAANQQLGKATAPVKTTSSNRKEMTFQEAVRRNESEAYIRNKMRPKGNLLDLIRNKKKK